MSRGVRWYLVGSVVLVSLTGCKTGFVAEEREPWRGEAEQACLKSGQVKEGPSVVMLPPINGPGMCGADFPLKVSMLGEGAPLGYEDEAVRPPSDVPQAAPNYPAARPAYPPNPQYGAPAYRPPPGYPPNTPFAVNPNYPADTRLPPTAGYDAQDQYQPAPPYPEAPRGPAPYEPPGPSGEAQRVQAPYQPPPYQPPPDQQPAPYSLAPAPEGPVSLAPPGYDPPNAEAAGDYQMPLPQYGAPRTAAPPVAPPAPAQNGPFPRSYPGSGQVVPMAPSRAATVLTTATVSPPATLACPLVSMLDRWIGEAVQPAAQKWFGQPVAGIKQISAYSCRGMNGNRNARISEHAFGNALDIAAFVLADGRTITVERGWHGTPEEQGFLRDVQGAACHMFNTVLAPGSNVYHYNHIHVDLMRRAYRPHICEPRAVPGDEIAARARARYARRDTGLTGSIGPRGEKRHDLPPNAYSEEDRSLPEAVAGED